MLAAMAMATATTMTMATTAMVMVTAVTAVTAVAAAAATTATTGATDNNQLRVIAKETVAVAAILAEAVLTAATATATATRRQRKQYGNGNGSDGNGGDGDSGGDSGGDSSGCACGRSIIHGEKGTTKKQNRLLTINACGQALTSRSECKCYFSMLKHTRRCGNCSATSICLLFLFPPQ